MNFYCGQEVTVQGVRLLTRRRCEPVNQGASYSGTQKPFAHSDMALSSSGWRHHRALDQVLAVARRDADVPPPADGMWRHDVSIIDIRLRAAALK